MLNYILTKQGTRDNLKARDKTFQWSIWTLNGQSISIYEANRLRFSDKYKSDYKTLTITEV